MNTAELLKALVCEIGREGDLELSVMQLHQRMDGPLSFYEKKVVERFSLAPGSYSFAGIWLRELQAALVEERRRQAIFVLQERGIVYRTAYGWLRFGARPKYLRSPDLDHDEFGPIYSHRKVLTLEVPPQFFQTGSVKWPETRRYED